MFTSVEDLTFIEDETEENVEERTLTVTATDPDITNTLSFECLGTGLITCAVDPESVDGNPANASADIIFTTAHKSKGLEYEQIVLASDFISKKEIVNEKTKMSDMQKSEELNIYYVAATRAQKVAVLPSLELAYEYKKEDDYEYKTKKTYKKTSSSKMKEMQEKWLKENRVKKDTAF